ncbi:hypothetical protein LTR48_006123 [Friedmanniomyces endolithicus]|uniref:C3H1-type domain-containing protein n=1 Tax=Rachicladosporium monterosium TaxID=1507873 RepID=A0ABR0L015_9PEZI|nr:hypothetical protein LTR48_006123 [Friedmanniomyces endolithicus]KAK5141336.1 hypothetical protein LTR32_006079 [Rachicladosporium monterosium]
MDQLPRSNDAYNNLFADSQPYHPYDSDFLNGNASTSQNPSWGLNTSGYEPNQLGAQGANHTTTQPGPGNQFNVNRALSHSPAPFGQNAFGVYPPQQSFQPYSWPQYDPALFPPGYGNQPQNPGTIAPHALQQSRSPAPAGNAYVGAGLLQSAVGQPRTSSASTPSNVHQNALIGAIPKGIDNGYMSTINCDQLVRATNSERMGNYLSVGRDAQEWPVNRTTTVPHGAILEKVHLDKVLPRYIKKGDAKTQFFAKRITANAAAAITATETVTPQVDKAAASTKTGHATSSSTKRPDPEPVAGIKRPASNAGEGGAIKKAATMGTKITGVATTAKPTGVVKRPATVNAVTKPAANVVSVVKTKQVTAKPSSFFSSLQSATKKPGTSIKAGIPAQAAGSTLADRKVAPPVTAAPTATFSFAETMAKLSMPKEEKPAATKLEKQLPSETAAEKAKRLRKEIRRKLHVSFKLGDELEQVRYFKHDPEEEIGHDDSQMRDVSDVGGEGRMLKLHAERMEVDEDDSEEADQKLVDFKEPSPVDFSVIDDDERARNYVQCGGKLELESAERAVREQYEANTLIVFYTDEKDIPPNPREPANPYDGEPTSTMKEFGASEEKFALRAKHRKAMRPQAFHAPQQPTFDLSALGHFVGHQHQGTPAQQVPNLDIQKLLDSLGPSLQQQQPQAPILGFPNLAPTQPPPMNQYQAPQQPGTQPIDLSAILAAIGGQPAAPQMTGAFGAPPVMGYQSQMQQPQMGGQYDGGNEGRSRHHGANSQYKTKVCKYWQEGKCAKGEACTYLHEEPGI